MSKTKFEIIKKTIELIVQNPDLIPARLFLIKQLTVSQLTWPLPTNQKPQHEPNQDILNCLIQLVNQLYDCGSCITSSSNLVFPHESLIPSAFSELLDGHEEEVKELESLLKSLFEWRIQEYLHFIHQCYSSISMEKLIKGFGRIQANEGIQLTFSTRKPYHFPTTHQDLLTTLQQYRPQDYKNWVIDHKNMVFPPTELPKDLLYSDMQLDQPSSAQVSLKESTQIASLSLSLIK